MQKETYCNSSKRGCEMEGGLEMLVLIDYKGPNVTVSSGKVGCKC